MFRLALHWQILIAMVVGAAIGVALNLTDLSKQTVEAPHEAGKNPAWEITDRPDRVEVIIYKKNTAGDPTNEMARRIVIDGSLKPAETKALKQDGAIHFPNVKEFSKSKEEADKAAYKIFVDEGRSWARWIGDASGTCGKIFLRMLQMVAIPLIIASLLTGVVGLGAAERLGWMFGRTFGYYLCTSLLAIATGLVMVNLISPGLENGVAAGGGVEEKEPAEERRLSDVLYDQLENLIPANPIAAAADGNFLSIISFTLLFGVFTIIVGGTAAETVKRFAESAFAVMMAMTMAIIRLAPLGVLFFILSATAVQGLGVFATLGWYMLTVAAALLFHAAVTLPLILKFIARRNPVQYAQAMSPALLTAFSSASSNGTLPLTMTCVEKRAGVSNRVSSFVLPLGATINMDGTALYEAVAVLFIAQFTGHNLEFSQQLIVAFTALLVSIGAAGIPHAGLVMMIVILQAVQLPPETSGLIIAVDRVLDMCRTSVNVWSDSCGCAVIARFEGEKPGEPEPIVAA